MFCSLVPTMKTASYLLVIFGAFLFLSMTSEGRYESLNVKRTYLNLISAKESSVDLTINTNKVLHTVSEQFLSVALDTDALARKKEWREFNTSSETLQTLSRELSPAFLRFGGTASDYVIFTGSDEEDCCQNDEQDNNNTQYSKEIYTKSYNGSNIHLTGDDWIKLNEFCAAVNWTLLFDLNALLRAKGIWNSTNARSLLKFNNNFGYHIAWELGNELNSHNKVPAHQLGKDFKTLRSLLNDFPATNYSLLVGPDISSSHDTALDFLYVYLKEAASVLDAVTFHQYNLNGHNATLSDFLNVHNFDALNITINKVSHVVNKVMPRLRLWLGETGTAYGGGAPGLSDTYVSGFLWLDKLGLSALRGINVVIRQSLMFSHYGLITSDMEPLPDYWLSVLHKHLVGPQVLQVIKKPNDGRVRVYAHCTAFGKLYRSKGSITIFVINLYNSTLNIKLSNPKDTVVHEYLLRPYGNEGLTSREVSLNGIHLKIVNGTIPKFIPKIVIPGQPINVPPFTFGFLVLPKSNSKACFSK